MPSHRRASVRDLTTAAYELDCGVVEGRLQRKQDGSWRVDQEGLDEWLSQYDGEQVVLVVASLEDDRPMPFKTCRRCGREYRGTECPDCREARIRLRGR